MWLHKEFILIVNSLEATSVYLYGWQNIQRHLLLVPIENTFLSYFICTYSYVGILFLNLSGKPDCLQLKQQQHLFSIFHAVAISFSLPQLSTLGKCFTIILCRPCDLMWNIEHSTLYRAVGNRGMWGHSMMNSSIEFIITSNMFQIFKQ